MKKFAKIKDWEYKTLKKMIVLCSRCLFWKSIHFKKEGKVKKILVISLDALGDALFTTPLLHALREYYPFAYIAICVKSESKEVVDTNPYINEVLTFDYHQIIQGRGELGPYKLYLKEKLNFLHKLRLKKFDLVIDCSGIISTNLFAFLSGASRVTGLADKGIEFLLNHPVLDDRNHTPYKNRVLKILNNLSIPPTSEAPEYFIPDKDKKFASQFLEKNKVSDDELLVGIHPFAGWKAKCWEPKKFAELINLMAKTYSAKVIIFGSLHDLEAIKAIKSMVSTKLLIVAGKTTLHETSALIKKCGLIVANDSIVLHLAETLDIPTVGIYGPTNPEFSALGRKKHRYINKKLKCSPIDTEYCQKQAGLDGKCKSIDCMRLLIVEDIWNVAKKQLDWITNGKNLKPNENFNH